MSTPNNTNTPTAISSDTPVVQELRASSRRVTTVPPVKIITQGLGRRKRRAPASAGASPQTPSQDSIPMDIDMSIEMESMKIVMEEMKKKVLELENFKTAATMEKEESGLKTELIKSIPVFDGNRNDPHYPEKYLQFLDAMKAFSSESSLHDAKKLLIITGKLTENALGWWMSATARFPDRTAACKEIKFKDFLEQFNKSFMPKKAQHDILIAMTWC
ncbi:hypothetical protein HMI54_012692 [Coelomomyces lativittatus]|nr:hypothetical protein HMI54_012692 [Coelomomyces lativittatus]